MNALRLGTSGLSGRALPLIEDFGWLSSAGPFQGRQ